MIIILKKQKVYYLSAILSIVAICLMGNLMIIDGKEYSVLGVIQILPELSEQYLGILDIQNILRIGISEWLYLLIPIVSLPFASYFSQERKSRFHLYVKARSGTSRYIRNRLLYAFFSSAAILFIGLGIYLAILCFSFGPALGYAKTTDSQAIPWAGALTLLVLFFTRLAYLCVYSTFLSLLASFIIYLYNDLYVAMSLIFLINYACIRLFQKNNIAYPLVLSAILYVLYASVEKWKGNKL